MRDSSNPELVAAWATVPEVAETEKRYNEVVQRLRQFRAGQDPEAARHAVIDDAVLTFATSGEWSDDVGKRAAKAYVDALSWESEMIAIRKAESQLKFAKEDTRDTCAEQALAFLSTRLDGVLSDAKRASVALNGVMSADAAIQAGGEALEAWRTLTALLPVVKNIREAQWSIYRAVADSTTVARLGQWQRAGHGNVMGFNPDDVPAGALTAMRTGTYDVPALVWLANIGTAYVPGSVADLEADVNTVTEPVSYDDSGRPSRDISPTVTPIPKPRDPATYPHSRAPHLDYSQSTPAPVKPNSSGPGDEKPPTCF
ncbi:hypothetical protein [Streptomyces lydicus]|uniref:hypothetical protein n=1 Tax=Streptomyces lydicus TaxID=47763 RepID=UPI0034424101